MSVKTIFKVLISVPVIMVVSALVIEMFNINIVAVQLKQMNKMAANQACTLFTQEVYKTDTDSGGGTANMEDIVDCDGNEYISGKFYELYNGEVNAEEVYKYLFVITGNGPESGISYVSQPNGFIDFYNQLGYQIDNQELKYDLTGSSNQKINKENFESKPWNIQLLINASKWRVSESTITNSIFNPNNFSEFSSSGDINWNSEADEIDSAIYKSKSYQFRKNLYTPANLGIPFIDGTTASKMFRWNLASILSNCNSANIKIDENGGQYISYKGFKCYAQNAEITNITYKMYDLSGRPGTDRNSEAVELKNETGIRVKGVNSSSSGVSIPSWDELSKNYSGWKEIDQSVIITATVDYEIPISYEGITYLGPIFSYVFNRNNLVEGLDGDLPEFDEQNFTSPGLNITGTLDSTYEGPIGTLPSAGKLVFTLVK